MHDFNKIKIEINSGTGGNGKICFIKNSNNKYIPAGGDGGSGGDVYLMSSNVTCFNYFKKFKIFAANGFNGKCNFRNGRNGDDLILLIPLGVVVKNIYNNKIIFNSNKNKILLILKGGSGGYGNSSFIKINNSNINFKLGITGKFMKLELDFYFISDIILIGYTNSGKSSLLNFLSTGKSRINNYPFTTLKPICGKLKLKYPKYLNILDIPGLIQNSYRGAGIGINYLKNINYSKVVLQIIDLSLLNLKSILFISDLKIINHELYKYDKYNFYKSRFLILNKFDINFMNFKKKFIKIYFYLINLYYYKIIISIKKKYGYKYFIKIIFNYF